MSLSVSMSAQCTTGSLHHCTEGIKTVRVKMCKTCKLFLTT